MISARFGFERARARLDQELHHPPHQQRISVLGRNYDEAHNAAARWHPPVSRFRSSRQYAAPSFANFGIEGHWQLIDLVGLWFRSRRDECEAQMMRTAGLPHYSLLCMVGA